jgi:DNA-directed RNA polymerase specialized sigma24 family protein
VNGSFLRHLEPIIKDEARRLARAHRHVEVEDAEQEARLILIEEAAALNAAEVVEALVRRVLRNRLIDRLVRSVPEEERNGMVVSFDAIADALEGAMDAEDGEPMSVDAAALGALSTPSHEDEAVDRVTIRELHDVMAALTDPKATKNALNLRRKHWIPFVQEFFDIDPRKGAA